MKELIKVLRILLEYDIEESWAKDNPAFDYFYVDIRRKKLKQKDIKKLYKLGFFIDKDYQRGGIWIGKAMPGEKRYENI